MLTKDLVQATVRNGKLFPKFLQSDDPSALGDARDVCEIFNGAKGRIIGELEDDVKSAVSTPRGRAFAKLLMDRCEVAEPGDEIIDTRWKAFAASERLRRVGQISHEDFQASLTKDLGLPLTELQRVIFADLPSARSIDSFETMSPESLVDAYNLSHITTFLCFADSVAVTLSNLTLPQKREVMRRLKFHRLMSDVEVDKDAKSVTLELSGPLRLFGKAQGYALRIANFFPFIASLPEWKLEAVIQWKSKKVLFAVDQKSGVKTESKRSHGGYVPKEFEQVIDALNAEDGLTAAPAEDFLHIGRQSYCFPDLVVKKSKQEFAIELFHPWHKGQFQGRLEAAARVKAKGLLLGVERSLLKDPEVKALCDANPWFQQFGFEYSQFPTPTVIKRVMARHD